MYAVIGTAGHVDHGKSALIQALTGIHPSHLPQELMRGMTIDLGFACLCSPDNDEIGIIDVPGHERFLRNMLSALWGLDLVLFVVAADEGWSPLSQEHLRVINALDLREIIVAVNKCDLVDDAQIGQVEEDILENFLAESDLLPDIWRVSAKTGEGIDALRQGLLTRVRNLKLSQALTQGPHLYIDRVFSVNGIGTTVTGTLRGDGVDVGDVLCLYPGNQRVKVKSIQSYHRARERAQPCSRVAMSFRQLKKEAVARGDCLAKPDADIAVSREWIVRLRPGTNLLKKQSELEVALGTSHTQARCYLLGEGRLARLQLSTPLPVFWGQAVLLMTPGGSRMAGAGRVVWTGPLSREQRPRLIEALAAQETDLSQLRCRVQLAVKGYVRAGDETEPQPDCHLLAGWWLADYYRQRCLTQLNKILSQATSALTVEELAARVQVPVEITTELVCEQCASRQWQKTAEGVSLFGASFGQLNHEQQMLLDEINTAGKLCFSAVQHERPRLVQQLKALTEKKYIVPMDDKLFIAREHYQALLEAVFHGCNPGELLSIADVRQRTGLARKQVIPLLNRMERDGWVRREGDLRRVRKRWLAEATM
ncbi:selenocysteine-specific translation elongation factor [Mixta tenebrionis]|uniref:Selenocysteine-specific translation elongation factor n=1 Tax=Mixta tenebrionis TaxID=2562439 RepID=A0A506V9Q1_9GAMM|nr:MULTISPECIES: selenocysteine-specific translation elongation factor [Mixta]QHM75033.1 Selenocysteine-specific elongation factor [Mixta theicola]TPW42664.1 selenocysteine-specific translation elongation factor [Mixta tenebrionis]